ncbi:hypothetical protein QJS04_geneDACA014286 [Acorus gramineus]|uniref:Uncharacterized protein n=1 Tax=Acorus gramineus TaxID=55184 RepID=A0AAV9BZA1_ACOGR|nr:hypothetical protein QJS04_geneDACA021994 [Acorus gramineus]KAK1281299.1 hypothetical protein QJS04_geneDACA014286 [Acorus gramineus]
MHVRWNSTYIMLQSCEGYENLIIEFNEMFNNRVDISPIDWQISKVFVQFLSIFYDASIACSGVYYPTSNLILRQLFNISCAFKEYRDYSILQQSIILMEQKFKKYFEDIPMLFCLAAVMDITIKLDTVKTIISRISDNVRFPMVISGEDVEFALTEMYKKYENKYANRTRASSSTSSISLLGKGKKKDYFFDFVSQSSHTSHDSSSGSSHLNELFKYLENDWKSLLTEKEMENFDLLQWWKAHEVTFPVLSIMARDLLTPPVSTVASESSFSTSGRILSERRTRLAASSLEALICLKDWSDADERNQEFVDSLEVDFTKFNIDDDQ